MGNAIRYGRSAELYDRAPDTGHDAVVAAGIPGSLVFNDVGTEIQRSLMWARSWCC